MSKLKRTWPLVIAGVLAAPQTRADGVDAEYDADHCELYVDTFGVGEFQHNGVSEHTLDAQVVVHESQLVGIEGGTLLAVGARLGVRRFRAAPPGAAAGPLSVTDADERVEAARLYPGAYRLRYAFERRETPLASFTELREFAFYLELRRRDGRTVRLWQRQDGSAPFTLAAVFAGPPGFRLPGGMGTISYAGDGSVVYDQKRACVR